MPESNDQHGEKSATAVNTKLVTLLYLLMRDHLPTGILCKNIQEAQNADMEKEFIRYSNGHLWALAKDYARRINE